jgi:hypothetical protein
MSEAVDYLSLDGLVTDETKSWAGGPGKGLPVGDYLVKIIGKSKNAAEGKTPQLEVKLEVVDDTAGGQHKGRQTRAWYYLTADAIGRLTNLFEAAGAKLDAKKGINLDSLMGTELVIGVYEEKFGGEANPMGGTTEVKTRSKVFDERPRSVWGEVKEKAASKK